MFGLSPVPEGQTREGSSISLGFLSVGFMSFQVLMDPAAPIADRYHQLFNLIGRQLEDDQLDEIFACLTQDPSELLRHEALYVLGQRQSLGQAHWALKALYNDQEMEVVRHEACEALHAMNYEDPSFLSKLEEYAENRELPILSDTCRLTLDSSGPAEAQREHCKAGQLSNVVDPVRTPLKETYAQEDPSKLGYLLKDPTQPLVNRYAALFVLRDSETPEGLETILEALKHLSTQIDPENPGRDALLRHEICFDLGALKSPAAVNVLGEILNNELEHKVVRHEAAMTLGELREARALSLLEAQLHHPEPLISQSCRVGLAISQYWEAFGRSC